MANGPPVETASAEGASATEKLGAIEFMPGYAAGMERARQQGKPAMVFFTAAWCTYCREMERDAFADPEIVRLSQEFVCVVIDADRDAEVCKEFDVRSFPTIQFLSPEGTILNRLVGGSATPKVADQMQAALGALVARAQLGRGTPPRR